ncbi:MAG: DUF948 domain-containing protein [candidate division KSB1 bacterium]|nr:DUF948 domain-containing protein [candidate division KSB1 bacterium]
MVLEIAVVVIAVCLVLITAGTIPVLLAIRRAVNESHKLIEQVRLQAAPLVHDATQIASDVRNVVKTLEREVPKIGESLDTLRGTAQDIRNFEIMLRERIEKPLVDLTTIIAGVARGLVVFWNALAHRR